MIVALYAPTLPTTSARSPSLKQAALRCPREAANDSQKVCADRI